MPDQPVISLTLEGPFFTKDVTKTYFDNLGQMLDEMAKEGTADVIAALQAGEGSRALISVLQDRVSDHVEGRRHSLSGKTWYEHARISVANRGFTKAGGISLYAAAYPLEAKYHFFRKTSSRLRSAVAVARADLTKGLE